MIPFSILDLSPIVQGSDASAGAASTRSILRSTPSAGSYHRYWLAEHHNIPSVASAATAVVIGAVAGNDLHDPRRRRRHHAAKPRPARDRRAIRHPRIAVCRPHRSRARPCAGLRSAHGTSAQTQSLQRCRYVSAGRARADHLLQSAARTGRESHSRRRTEDSDLDSGIQPVRRAARRRARAAVRLRVAFRPRTHDARHRGVSQPVPAVGVSCASARHARRQRRGGGDR